VTTQEAQDALLSIEIGEKAVVGDALWERTGEGGWLLGGWGNGNPGGGLPWVLDTLRRRGKLTD
jgi:hypothetical protein